MHHMLPKIKLDQARIETTVEVFDPFGESAQSTEVRKQLQSRVFKQVIHTNALGFLNIETKDEKGSLLHTYFRHQGNVVAVQHDPNRVFATHDVIHHYFEFTTTEEDFFRQALWQNGIMDTTPGFWKDEEFEVYYRFGHPNASRFLLIDKKEYWPREFRFRLHSPKREHMIRVVFSQFKESQSFVYPETTLVYDGNVLVKRIFINKLTRLKDIPIKQMQATVQKFLTARTASLAVDYTR